LARRLADEGGFSFQHERLQWSQTEATESYYLTKWQVTAHLRNSLDECAYSSGPHQRTFTAWASIYNPTFLGRSRVDQSSELMRRIATEAGWKARSNEQCEGTA
jgi:hypothetical protein